MVNLKAYLHTHRQKVNAALEGLFDRHARTSVLVKAMCHSLLDGGKRLRPILCIGASQAVGGSEDAVLTAACALELIHTYSLIHDDLPAMDNDDLRRGKPTCHVAFNEATAILAGDALLTLAFEILAARALDDSGRTSCWVAAIATIARAAGYRGMVEGQVRDIGAQSRSLSEDELEALHRLKTGALIEASVNVGAVLAGADQTQVAALARYARHIGLAFQVADDVLDVEGDPAVMGKAAGSDARLQKNTYPALIGLARSSPPTSWSAPVKGLTR